MVNRAVLFSFCIRPWSLVWGGGEGFHWPIALPVRVVPGASLQDMLRCLVLQTARTQRCGWGISAGCVPLSGSPDRKDTAGWLGNPCRMCSAVWFSGRQRHSGVAGESVQDVFRCLVLRAAKTHMCGWGITARCASLSGSPDRRDTAVWLGYQCRMCSAVWFFGLQRHICVAGELLQDVFRCLVLQTTGTQRGGRGISAGCALLSGSPDRKDTAVWLGNHCRMCSAVWFSRPQEHSSVAGQSLQDVLRCFFLQAAGTQG